MANYSEPYIFSDQPPRRRGIGCLLAIVLLLAGICTGIYLFNRAINQVPVLKNEYVRVMALNDNFEGFRVLHISDLAGDSIGSNAERWKKLLEQQKWNAVVMSGDMVGSSNNSEPMLSLIHLLLTLNPDAPVYFVAGDGDPDPIQSGGGSQVFASWVVEAQKAGAIYLDAPMSLPYKKYKVWFSPVYLYGMDSKSSAESLKEQIARIEAEGRQYDQDGSITYRTLQYRLDAMNRTLAAMEEISENDLQIAVNHLPLETEYIRDAVSSANTGSIYQFRAVELILCGHLCGGQYRLPWFGAVYAPGKGFFPGDDGLVGMARVNSTNMYISPGLSSASWAPLKLRIFNKPTASILRFTSQIE